MAVSPYSGSSSLAAAPIGGQYISSFGGVLGFTPYQGNRALESSPSLLLDCKSWTLTQTNFTDDTTHTGSYGGQGIDITAQGCSFQASIIWDLRNEPDFAIKYAGGYFAASFNVGCRMSFFLGDAANYPADAGATFWYVPSMKMLSMTPIIDAGSKKMVGCSLAGIGNSRSYRLSNYSIGSTYEGPGLTQYITHLATRNLCF